MTSHIHGIIAALILGVLSMTATQAHANPLATPDQIAAEKATLRIEASPKIQMVRNDLRKAMLADPGSLTADGRASMDRALDQWIRAYILMQLSTEQQKPAMLWVADNSPRSWFGHVFPGDIIAGDNPDNSNRISYIDGSSSYALTGRYGSPKSGQFSLNVDAVTPENGIGDHVATLTDTKIELKPDGTFRVTIDAKPANGRRNHMTVRPGGLLLAARDSRSDWKQLATTLSLRLVSGPGISRTANEEALTDRIVSGLPTFVNFWRKFKDGFFGFPEANMIVPPKRRDSEGGWGYLAGGRFKLANDDALIIIATDGGAAYTGFQVTDPWTLRPETVLRTSSLNKSQARANPDGSYTYVVSLQDPGVANWIDTAGLHEGWMQLRWQNVPDGGAPTAKVVQLAKLSEIDKFVGPETPRADLAYRRNEISRRIQQFSLRTLETPPDALPK
jgi:hypothetical protein